MLTSVEWLWLFDEIMLHQVDTQGEEEGVDRHKRVKGWVGGGGGGGGGGGCGGGYGGEGSTCL